jgi:serine/threonine-protein kinase RsbT
MIFPGPWCAAGRARVSDAHPESQETWEELLDLVPLIRRAVAARVRDPHHVDDLVQETLARVMAARARIDGTALAPYAVVTARNLVTSFAQRDERARRKAHLLVDVELPVQPDDELLEQEDRSVVAAALARLQSAERDVLLAHEVEGIDTATLAATHASTPGAIAARLNRARARLRVEYLLAQYGSPPGEDCRAVLIALSMGDRRRQRELDTAGHLLTCDFCPQLSSALLERRLATDKAHGVRVAVCRDRDVVAARQKAREVAGQAGFSGPELTLIATAVSEIARNIVMFAERGVIVVTAVDEPGRSGVTVVARDRGPGIPDVGQAMADGYSTYGGLGLGLAGSRRLMDEFDVVSEAGKGTTVTMSKWR